MADTASIAKMRDGAFRRMQEAMQRIGGVTGVEPVTLPVYDPDAAYLEAWRLDVMATYAESVANAVAPLPEPVAIDPYASMSADDAVAEASRRGMKTNSRTSKQAAVDYLLASDGVTEDEQAALDSVDEAADDESAD